MYTICAPYVPHSAKARVSHMAQHAHPAACCAACGCRLLPQINSYAFSGGGATVEEHRAKGANLDVDVPWKYLNFFMEDDDKLAHIGREYGAGRMLTGGCGWDATSNSCQEVQQAPSRPQLAVPLLFSAGEVKAELITLLVDIVARHKRARAQVTDDIVDAFMAVRPFKCFAS